MRRTVRSGQTSHRHSAIGSRTEPRPGGSRHTIWRDWSAPVRPCPHYPCNTGIFSSWLSLHIRRRPPQSTFRTQVGQQGLDMSRIVGRLNARKVATAKLPKGKTKHVLADGGNLFLEITQGAEGACRSWLFQYQLHHRRRFMGLGPTHTVSLSEARAKARSLRQQLIDGVDPLEAKRERVRAAIAAAAKATTFEQCANSYIKLHGDGWSAKHLRDWQGSLRKYVFGKIGKLSPGEIDSALVMKVVEPHWKTRTVTMGRTLDRVAMVWDFAKTSGYCSCDNPARATRSALPKQSKITAIEHYAAMPFDRVPAFMAALRAHDSIAARALELLVLAAARTEELRLATWSE